MAFNVMKQGGTAGIDNDQLIPSLTDNNLLRAFFCVLTRAARDGMNGNLKEGHFQILN